MQAALVLLTLLAASGPDSVRIDVDPPAPWVLGSIDTLRLTLHAPEPSGPLRPLRLSTNVGRFSEVRRIKAGLYEVDYALPNTRHPQVAVIALWRETGPDAQIDFRTIELWGKTSLPLTVRKRAEVTVFVGGTSFGPQQADRKGRLSVPIEVPPGVLEVTVRATSGKRKSELVVPVEVPPYNRLALAVTPYKVPADGASTVTAHAYYVGESPKTVELTATQGNLSPSKKVGSNRFVATFVPSRSSVATNAKLSAVALDAAKSQASVELELGRPVAESILVNATEPFYAGAEKRPIKVTVLDRAGLAVEGLTVRVQVATASVTAAAELGKGEYQFELKPPASYTKIPIALTVEASREGEPTLKTSASLVVEAAPWPAMMTVGGYDGTPQADPDKAFGISVLALDARGDPVTGRQLSLQAAGATVEQSVQNGASLTADLRPTPGAEQITLQLVDSEGPAISHSIGLKPMRPAISVGGYVAARLQSSLLLGVGLEFGYRPDIWNRRLMISLAGGLEWMRRDLDAVGLPGPATATGTFLLLPAMLGVSADIYRSDSLTVYVRGEGGVAPWLSQTDFNDVQSSDGGLALGGGGALGGAMSGFYMELAARGLRFENKSTVVPTFGAGIALGYRLGL